MGTKAALASLVVSSLVVAGTVWARARSLDAAVPAFGPIAPWVTMWQGLARAYTLALVAAGGVWLAAATALVRQYRQRAAGGVAGRHRAARCRSRTADSADRSAAG